MVLWLCLPVVKKSHKTCGMFQHATSLLIIHLHTTMVMFLLKLFELYYLYMISLQQNNTSWLNPLGFHGSNLSHSPNFWNYLFGLSIVFIIFNNCAFYEINCRAQQCKPCLLNLDLRVNTYFNVHQIVCRKQWKC